jgi:hypothetical protein
MYDPKFGYAKIPLLIWYWFYCVIAFIKYLFIDLPMSPIRKYQYNKKYPQMKKYLEKL